jgi:putative phage-type endonuclease
MNKTITIGDLEELLSRYEEDIYCNIKNKNDFDELKKDCLVFLKKEYKLNDRSLSLNNSQDYFFQSYLNDMLEKKKNMYEKRITRIKEEIPDILEELKKLDLPEQRSQEWYELRNNVLTASSLATALGKGHFGTRLDLLIDKTSTEEKPFISNDIIEWGVKYEPIATTFYEKINKLKIVEFGLVPHPELTIFGASPDGICDSDSNPDYVGRMLEIKCPPVRKFTKEVPHHYWIQMQGQLETCDLEECDFLQVKLLEYKDEEEYNDDICLMYDTTVMEGYSGNNLPKGLMITISYLDDKNNKKYMYEYPEFYLSYTEYLEWFDLIKDKYTDEKYTITKNWWKIERYECTLVGRDREWWTSIVPDIIDFWEDVESYRQKGNQELVDKKNKRRRKKKPVENIIVINKEIKDTIENKCLLDSDSEE